MSSFAPLVLGLSACASTLVEPAPVIARPTPRAADLRDPRFVEPIARAAQAYRPWGRVDERPNIAPDLCRMPRREDYGMPSHVRQSKAPDGPHGTKLYYLWASPRPAYFSLDQAAVPNGFTIVKESFAATTTPSSSPKEIPYGTAGPVQWIETARGTLFAGAPVGLYVMTKVGAGEGTDEGWIYGTVSATGEVTSAGRVESCMGCHEAAPHGRLFGLQPTKQLVDPAPPGTPSWKPGN